MVNCQYRYFVPPHRVDNPVITDDQFSNIVPAYSGTVRPAFGKDARRSTEA